MKKILMIGVISLVSMTTQTWAVKEEAINSEDATLFSITGGLKSAYDEAKKLGSKVLSAATSAATFGISAVKNVVDIAKKYGPDLAPKVVSLAKIVGPFVFELTKKYGLDAINLIYKYGPSTVKSLVAKHGDKIVGYAMDYGPKVFGLVQKHGPAAFDLLTKLGAAALKTL
jgi:hypothetical protein